MGEFGSQHFLHADTVFDAFILSVVSDEYITLTLVEPDGLGLFLAGLEDAGGVV